MKILLILLLVPSIAFSQWYATANFTSTVSHKKMYQGFNFGAGYKVSNYSGGFLVEGLDISNSKYGIAALDLRYYLSRFFVSLQPGKVLYEQDKVKGSFSYTGLIGFNLSFLTVSAGYQNVGFTYAGSNSRSGAFKANIGITVK